MSCFHGYLPGGDANEAAFAIDTSAIVFGPGVLGELGARAQALGGRRVALFTDPVLGRSAHVEAARRSLQAEGLEVITFDEVHVEPTDASFAEAARFARQTTADLYVSVGGGSTIDTCKAALLFATYPAELLAYVNAPIGEARPVPGPLPPHLACPTTCGTGSETTGIAVFDHLGLKVKTAIASARLRPTQALIDPGCTLTLPPMVVAASGFDVLCHALESYTARPYTARPRPATPHARPMSQGRNPWSDLGSLEALRIAGRSLVAAVAGDDPSARQELSWAATLAGIAFGNSGVHLPHAMSYAVAGRVRDYRCPGYPQDEALVPHGVSVVVSAPSVFAATAVTSPARHLTAAAALGADVHGVREDDAAEVGTVLATRLIALMHATGVPLGLQPLGYGAGDLEVLAEGALAQRRLVDNAPLPIDAPAMQRLFAGALAYAAPEVNR
jgi:alcohol dehydrogenase class IV